MRPFGCRILYHPVADQLPTFQARLPKVVCIEHTVVGIYLVLTSDGTVRTEYVRAYEDEFEAISRILPDCKTVAYQDKDRVDNVVTEVSLEYCSCSDSKSGGDTSEEDARPRTYLPTEQARTVHEIKNLTSPTSKRNKKSRARTIKTRLPEVTMTPMGAPSPAHADYDR